MTRARYTLGLVPRIDTPTTDRRSAGDRNGLRPLLSDDTYKAFAGAIDAREQAGHAQHTEIRSIEAATIEQASLTGTHAAIAVHFVSDQVSLTAGQAHDVPAAYGLLDQLAPRTIVLGDKAYDADGIRDLIEAQGEVPNIPAKSTRKWKPCFSKRLYRERNLVERFFNKIKQFRGIATRYDKDPKNYLAAVKLVAMRIWCAAL